MTLSLIPNRQTIEGRAREHHKTLADRTWGDQGSYRQPSTATRARVGEDTGGAASALTHEHTQGEALTVDNSCGRPSWGISTGHSLVRSRFLKNGECVCGGSASPETILPTPTTRAPAPGILLESSPRRLGPLRPVQGTRSAQYLNSHLISTHSKNSI